MEYPGKVHWNYIGSQYDDQQMKKDYQDLEMPEVVTIPNPWTFKDLVFTVTFKPAYTGLQLIQRPPTSIQSVRPALGETLNVDED